LFVIGFDTEDPVLGHLLVVDDIVRRFVKPRLGYRKAGCSPASGRRYHRPGILGIRAGAISHGYSRGNIRFIDDTGMFVANPDLGCEFVGQEDIGFCEAALKLSWNL